MLQVVVQRFSRPGEVLDVRPGRWTRYTRGQSGVVQAGEALVFYVVEEVQP